MAIVPPVGGFVHKTCTMRLQGPPVGGAVTVFVAGLAGAVDRILEVFGRSMLTITVLYSVTHALVTVVTISILCPEFAVSGY
jgi:hypothetical protein